MKKKLIFICFFLITLSLFPQANWDLNYRHTTVDQILKDVGSGLTDADNNYTGQYGKKYKIQMQF